MESTSTWKSNICVLATCENPMQSNEPSLTTIQENMTGDATKSTRPPEKSSGGIGRISGAIRYSLSGFQTAFREEAAFRQEVALLALLSPLPFFLVQSGLARAVMIGSLLCILIVELINSSIEAAVDRISTDRHPLAKNAKDLGSAAVMLTILMAVAIWSIVLLS